MLHSTARKTLSGIVLSETPVFGLLERRAAGLSR
jgi:hypothetical protein